MRQAGGHAARQPRSRRRWLAQAARAAQVARASTLNEMSSLCLRTLCALGLGTFEMSHKAMAFCHTGIARVSSQLDDTRQGVQRTRGRCAAHAPAVLHVRSAAHGPLVESSEPLEREQVDLNTRRQRRQQRRQFRRRHFFLREARRAEV